MNVDAAGSLMTVERMLLVQRERNALRGLVLDVCRALPAVADTLVEMGMGVGSIRTALNLDSALRVSERASHVAQVRS